MRSHSTTTLTLPLTTAAVAVLVTAAVGTVLLVHHSSLPVYTPCIDLYTLEFCTASVAECMPSCWIVLLHTD